jgi:DNA repair protein RecO (recombination protein O)
LIEQGPCRQAHKTDKTISGRSLKHLECEQGFDVQSLSEIKRLMRQVIDYYLAGRPLQSRHLFAQLKQIHSQLNH